MNVLFHLFLTLELLFLFGFLPFAIFMDWLVPRYVLFGGLVWVIVYLIFSKSFSWRENFRWPKGAGIKREWLRIFRVWLAFVAVSAAAMAFLQPERILFLATEMPQLYLAIMLLYPLVSVLPQELLFRAYFHDRYRPVLGGGWPMILVAGVAFGWAHVIFNIPEDPLRNPVAVPLTIAGGILFSYTYERTRNLWPVCVEHALYGDWIWTVGLGWYFFYAGQQGTVPSG